MKSQLKYTISFYTNLQESKKSWLEINRAMRVVERAYKWADKHLRKVVYPIVCNYPNNYKKNNLVIAVNIDNENVGHSGGSFYPEDNEIVINKYAEPICYTGVKLDVLNLLKDKKRLRHIIVHELIHYAFTEYKYTKERQEPTEWRVGLSPWENTDNPVDKSFDKKWGLDEWLDEVLTETLARYITGWPIKHTIQLYEQNLSDEHNDTLEKVKQRFVDGPVVIENIINALYYHDKSIFLDSKYYKF